MAALFSDNQMVWLRSYFGDLSCRDDCAITRTTGGSRDSLGSPGSTGGTTQRRTVKADVYQPGAGTLAEYANKVSTQITWQVDFPYGTDVQEGDTLVISGKEMKVQVVLDPNTYRVFTSVLAAEEV